MTTTTQRALFGDDIVTYSGAQVWSCGGGTQSAAIAALICQGRLDKPDVAIMVDTEREKASTWRYVHGVIVPNLRAVGVELQIVPKSTLATVDLYGKNGDLLLPVYTEKGKMPTFCANEWKVRVAERWLRAQGHKDWVTWLGFSTNEMRRVRAGKGLRYPLLEEGIQLSREGCVNLVRSLGWPDPPRSSCWMCPNQSDEEWMAMDREDFEKACHPEDLIREKDSGFFFHRSRVPLREVQFGTTPEEPADKRECTGGCFL